MYWSAGRLFIGWAKAIVAVVAVTDDDVIIGSSKSGGEMQATFNIVKNIGICDISLPNMVTDTGPSAPLK